MKAGEIYVDLRLRKDKFDKGLDDSKKSIKMFALEALASVYLLDRFAEKSTNAATKITNLSRASGIATQDLKRYGLAASLTNAGIGAEEASEKIAAFSKNLIDIRTTGLGNQAGFNQLGFFGKGIDRYTGTTLDVLKRFGAAVKDLPDPIANSILDQQGLSGLLPLLRSSESEIDKMTKGLVLTNEENASLEKTDRLINSIKSNWSFMQDKLVLQISPALEEFGQILKETGMNLSGGNDAPKQQYKSFDDYISQRGWGGFIWDSLKGGIPIMGNAAKDIGSTALLGAKTIFGGAGGGKAGLNNVGNLRDVQGNFRSFATPQEGLNSLIADISAKVGGRSTAMASKYGAGYIPTLDKLINTYAPPSENNTKGYTSFVEKQTGIDANRPLTAADIDGIVKAIVKMEGNKNITMNNTNHIHGSDAKATAGMIGDSTAVSLKHAFADQNNGAF